MEKIKGRHLFHAGFIFSGEQWGFFPCSSADQVTGGGKDYRNICSGIQYYLGLKLMNCETLMKMKSATNHCC